MHSILSWELRNEDLLHASSICKIVIMMHIILEGYNWKYLQVITAGKIWELLVESNNAYKESMKLH